MADKQLILILVAEQGYIRSTQERNFDAPNEILFNAISDTYLPLLNMLGRLEADGVPCKLGLVMSATVCSLLSDPQVQKQYVDFLDRRIAFGDQELERNGGNEALLAQTRDCLKKLQKDKIGFVDVYQENLVEQFRLYAQKGMLEIIATAATYAYLPHYADLTEALNAQVETGLHACRAFFGDAGEGFYLPYLGWTPELDRVLRSYGVNYTVVNTRSILFAGKNSERGIFSPVRTARSLVLFGQDFRVQEELAGKNGCSAAAAYRAQQRDAGFDRSEAELADFLDGSPVRLQTGFKYWTNGSGDGTDRPYDAAAAREQADRDARAFYEAKDRLLSQAAAELDGGSALLTCTIPAELLGQLWHEGVDWLERVIRLCATGETHLSFCREHLEQQFSLPKITPYPCAESGSGYAEDLLDSSNNWMMRYVRKATERIIDLTERFPAETGLKARLLNIGTREVLLAQAGDWPKMIHEGQLPVFAADELKKNILAFSTVFDSLASNTVSTEWLTRLEKEHPIFPWINYRIFSRKK